MNESIQVQTKKPSFSVAITTDKYKSMINRSIQDPQEAKRFIAAITSAVAVNPALQGCEPSTVLAGALLGNSLNLSPSPQLGQYYLVPFKNKAKYGRNGELIKPETTDAQFVLGYKGLIQLALRSGQYKRLNVMAIKEGELISFDPLTEEIELSMIQDDEQREAAKTSGYIAMFEYLNGFRKTIYWSHKKMEAHALRYSKGYAAKKGYTFWEKDFDAMAYKTMLRQLISKWGIMSIDMQRAFEQDTVEDREEYMDTGENPFTATQPVQEYQDADVYVVQDSSPDAQPVEPEKAQVKLDEL